MARIELLEEVILPAAVLTGTFGEDTTVLACDSQEGSHGKDQFASVIMFSSMEIENKNQTEKLHLVVKSNQESEVFRKSVLTDSQLQNELFMYENLLPFLNITEDIIPKFYYGVATRGKNPELDVILMQDIHKENYCVKEGDLALDYDHVITALQQLAKFHAASYRAKVYREEGFYERVERLTEVEWVKEKISVNVLLIPIVKKVVHELIAKQKYVTDLKEFLVKVSDPLSYTKTLVNPSEPLSVVCHGDFNRDNILFKYNDKGAVVGSRFVDFGTSRYSSPITDLSFFLFCNTTSSMRREHLDDFLTEYYDSLKSFCGEVQIPGIEIFEAEFFSKAVYGFLECCLLIPIALSEPVDWEEMATLTEEQMQDNFVAKCDRQATSLLTDILRDLLRYKCKI